MKAIVFDMDGVLFDTEHVCMLAFADTARRVGLENGERMAILGLGLNDEAWKECFRREYGELTEAEAFLRESEEYIAAYYRTHRVPVKKGLYSILPYLKENGWRVAVASSSPEQTVRYRLDDTGVTAYFDEIICGDMVRRSKPAPDIFLEACRLLGCPSSECYAVEDSPNGMKAATAAGCKTIFVPDLWLPEREMPELYCKRLPDLDAVREYLQSVTE